MTPFEPGDIVLVLFPFTDFSTAKQRPCVVLSSSRFNRSHRDVILAAITSNVHDRPDENEYLLTDREQQMCGLPKVSMIKAAKIVTVDQRLVRVRLGRLPAASLQRIRSLVHRII
ncbi:type II toxin-antitoxin system PemK/MazF family toxin [Candidatus Peregrinibacteria bacterium]|nr:type II toxin-antitoxin system PemK/MazF family toxin [Candidatus Peregrinibacteria bacterium]MBI3816292.1 type II toxin-antitoxin system PemK/MazF family toxin [Candidatus Peregrinibacteria bacterium]